jgi:hypothetical protein
VVSRTMSELTTGTGSVATGSEWIPVNGSELVEAIERGRLVRVLMLVIRRRESCRGFPAVR